MEQLSDRINAMAESESIKMTRLSRELINKGHHIISLSLGEPDFGTPRHISDAVKEAVDEGYTHYPPVNGYPDLLQAIADKFKKDNELDFKTDQIVVSNGAKQSLANLILSICNPGDEVVLPAPYWHSYPYMIKLAEGIIKPIYTSIDTDFKITPAQLDKAITSKTKLFIYSSPCNPSGTVYSKEELAGLAEVVDKYKHIYVVSDEVYEHINFTRKHESISQFENIRDRVIMINGLSKSFAMTGWRVGYMAAPQWLAKACSKIQGQYTSGVCGIAQRAALKALTSDMEPTYKMREAFEKRKNMVYKLLSEISGIKINNPQGAFYIFPDVSYYIGKTDGETTINDVSEFCMYILHKAHVSIVTGKVFGDNNCVRISCAASEEELTEAMERIKKALEKLH